MTTLLLLAACVDEGPAAVLVAAQVEPSVAVPTVGTLVWETDVPFRGRVRITAAGWEQVTGLESAASTAHRTVLVGASADTGLTWQVEDEGGAVLGSGSWETGSLPAGLPALTTNGGSVGRFLVTTFLGAYDAAVVLDPEGRVVWWWDNDSGLDAMRAAPTRDGAGVRFLVGDVSGDPSPDSELRTVSWDGAEVTTLAVPYLAQDFVELDDGTVAAITAEVHDDVKGSGIVEVAPDGSYRTVWTSWDCFDPVADPGDDPELGWTWVNALDYDSDTEHYVLSARNLTSIVWVDRATGTCDRIVGGARSDYTFVGERFRHTHQFQTWDDHLLVFDNDGAGATRSRVLEYALDDGAGVATQTWEYEPDPAVYSFVLGDVTRLDDGSTVATFSVAGQLDHVDAAGELGFRAQTPAGLVLGYVTVVEALGG